MGAMGRRFGRAFALLLACAAAAAGEAAQPAGSFADLLPHSRPAFGERDIAAAWLAEPTARYDHGILGDALEAGTLRVRTSDRRLLEARLDVGFVFEDLRPRLVDLTGDGLDEIVVVRSSTQAGASLAVYGIAGGRLVEMAATPPIGRHRWLNPIGAADLDGDGRIEVAYVQTPHIGGILRVWQWRDGGLVDLASARGVSNHRIGTTELDLHALVDWNGDGLPDIVLPEQAGTALRVFTLAGAELREIDRIPLEGAAVTRIEATREGLRIDPGERLILRP